MAANGGACVSGADERANRGLRNFSRLHFQDSEPIMRTRTPTAVLELRGSFNKHPERRQNRALEPICSGPLGQPPSTFTEPQRAAWKELERDGFWLVAADRFMVEVAADLIAKQRAGDIDNPARALLVATLSKLGFGPTERSKIKVPEPTKVGSFDKFR
jgi:hypothetical protein